MLIAMSTMKYENRLQLVIASEAKQSHHLEADYFSKSGDCFVAPLLAKTKNVYFRGIEAHSS